MSPRQALESHKASAIPANGSLESTATIAAHATRSFLCAREQMRVLPISRLGQLAHRNEAQRRRVDAIAQPGRSRSVIEQVAEVRISVRRANFGAHHAGAVV